ncbi:unnamed protein product [Mytilus coruscus]|uniref:Integrase catalytic domain-containing protein n=1 Tax=Mytilus coruscus TaxID=42192 RepID=A0A6J8C6P3_MYTCO|nr:unnamed protein product [Mytilus coruscus]
MQVPDALSRYKNSKADVVESPVEDDPFFPFVEDVCGKVKLPNGQIFSELIASKVANVQAVRLTDNAHGTDTFISDPYDADTDESDDYIRKKNQMGKIIPDYVQSCHRCQIRKVSNKKTKQEIVSFQTPAEPYQVWQMDLCGPYPVSVNGNTFVFTAVDMFTKLLFAYPLRNKNAITVCEAIYRMFTTYGVCQTLISDRCSEFTNKCTAELCKLLAVTQEFMPTFAHHCLGACERQHRTLAERLTTHVLKGKPWENELYSVLFSMNSSVNNSIDFSPFEILYGKRPYFPLIQFNRESFKDIPVDMLNNILSSHFIKLRDPTGKRKLSDRVHINRLKIAHIRAPDPAHCLAPLNAESTESEENETLSSSKDDDIEKQQSDSVDSEPHVRRSTRKINKPLRFRDENFVTANDIESSTDAKSEKVKRILAKKKNGNQSFLYLVQLDGEPSQNAQWRTSE